MHASDPQQLARYLARYGDVKVARSEAEILDDESVQVVASASIPNLRAQLGIRVMRAGKDFLSDKPGITSLAQLAEVRRTIAATGRKFAIMYSERLEVRAAVKAGTPLGVQAKQIMDEGGLVSAAPKQARQAQALGMRVLALNRSGRRRRFAGLSIVFTICAVRV